MAIKTPPPPADDKSTLNDSQDEAADKAEPEGYEAKMRAYRLTLIVMMAAVALVA